MTALSNLISRAIQQTHGHLGNPTFTWKGTIEIPCTRSTERRGAAFVTGGVEVDILFSLHVEFDEFFSMDTALHTVDSELWTADDDRPHPVVGRTLVFIGREYKIVRVDNFRTDHAANKGFYILDLADPNAGRR